MAPCIWFSGLSQFLLFPGLCPASNPLFVGASACKFAGRSHRAPAHYFPFIWSVTTIKI